MTYLSKILIVFYLTLFLKFVYSESNCGAPLCVSTKVIKPGEPVELSWHKSDNKNGLQISLLYGDNSDITDCHELQGKEVLKSWRLKNGEEEYSFTLNEVDFQIEDKTFVFLVEYLASNFCMMAPSGPPGLGTSYVVFDEAMPVRIGNQNNGNTANDGTGNNDNSSNNTNGDYDNSNNTDGNNDQNNRNSPNAPIEGNKDDSGFFNTFTIILLIALGIILLLIGIGLFWMHSKKMKDKDKNSNADSLKQNSTARILSPNLTDDAFAEDSVYSAVNINNALAPPKQVQNDPYAHNISVESFNSTTSQSGLISRHEAKMIAERFRCELQNPLNNEADDASSIKGKEESV